MTEKIVSIVLIYFLLIEINNTQLNNLVHKLMHSIERLKNSSGPILWLVTSVSRGVAAWTGTDPNPHQSWARRRTPSIICGPCQ